MSELMIKTGIFIACLYILLDFASAFTQIKSDVGVNESRTTQEIHQILGH